MNLDKRKFLVIGILVVVVLFIIIYSMMIIDEGNESPGNLEETEVPELTEEKKQYNSRLEAVDQLSEEKPQSLPGLYDEDLIDNSGDYDPYLKEKEKMELMDSILNSGPELTDYQYNHENGAVTNTDEVSIIPSPTAEKVDVRPIGHGHAIFFLESENSIKQEISREARSIRAEVYGNQVVQKDQRLKLRLIDSVIIASDTIPANSVLYAFCSFQPNRLLLNIPRVGDRNFQLDAFDISDGQKGIYIENSFRSQAATQVIDDVIQDINISGVPQVSGLKGIFKRSNRSVKVKVLHHYQLNLKPVL